MERQLALLDPTPGWRLSERTREIGRRGIASARQALAEGHPVDSADDDRADRSAA